MKLKMAYELCNLDCTPTANANTFSAVIAHAVSYVQKREFRVTDKTEQQHADMPRAA